jgi:transposase InsO family protein
MKATKFMDAQKVFVIKQGEEGAPVAEICHKAGIIRQCLNTHWFLSLQDACEKLEAWRRDYNEVRPHSAIGNKPPISLMLASAAHGPP